MDEDFESRQFEAPIFGFDLPPETAQLTGVSEFDLGLFKKTELPDPAGEYGSLDIYSLQITQENFLRKVPRDKEYLPQSELVVRPLINEIFNKNIIPEIRIIPENSINTFETKFTVTGSIKPSVLKENYETGIDFAELQRSMAEERARQRILQEEPDAVEIVRAYDAEAMMVAMDEAFRDFYPDIDGHGISLEIGYYNGKFIEKREPSRAMVTVAEPDIEWMKTHNANIDATGDPQKAPWKFVAVQVRRKPTSYDIRNEMPILYVGPNQYEEKIDEAAKPRQFGANLLQLAIHR
jgi:hypothetical protein